MAIGVHKTGVITVKVSAPPVQAGSALEILGEFTDQPDISERAFYNNVPGDRNGGPQGPPIEIQDLGAITVISFALSQFDVAVVNKLRSRGRTKDIGTAPEGEQSIAQVDVGAFKLLNGSFRLCLDPVPDSGVATDVSNFWCCIMREPISYNAGTKYKETRFVFEAHKPPPGHVKAGILSDNDNADLPP